RRLTPQPRRDQPLGVPRKSGRGIVLFEPRMLPAVRAPVTTFVTIPTRSISRYGGRWVNLLAWRDGPHTKGSFTTRAGCKVPRMSTSNVVPMAEAALFTEASAIPTRREGDIVPLVTGPTSAPRKRTRAPGGGIHHPPTRIRTRLGPAS